tara:strand:- start:9339 stop:9920 length:582 start_codon:yes stop_codon:yes gene_type:complete
MFNSNRSFDNQAVTHSTVHGLVVLSVSVGGEMFAIDVRSVREIHAWVRPSSLPGAPHYLQGMLNFCGEVVPLVLLARRLGLAETGSTAPVTVMIEREADTIGLVVDAVCDLHSIAADQLSVTPAVGAAGSARLLKGVITLDDSLMCLLDVEEMLPANAIPEAALLAAGDPDYLSRDPSPTGPISSEAHHDRRL